MGKVQRDKPADLFPDEMTLFAGAQCLNPAEFGARGTDLWVLLAEDEHPYSPEYRRVPGDPSRDGALAAIDAAIEALTAARQRVLASPVLTERL